MPLNQHIQLSAEQLLVLQDKRIALHCMHIISFGSDYRDHICFSMHQQLPGPEEAV